MAHPYTLEYVHKLAKEHFDALEERPYLMKLSQAEAAVSVAISRRLFDASVRLPVGELLQFSSVLDWSAADDTQRGYLLGTLPFLAGCLGLLDMEFFHETAGVLPIPIVRELLEKKTIDYKDANLTEHNVVVQYRRLALAPEAQS